MRRNVSVLVILLLVGVVTFVMLRAGGPKSGEIKDEAMLANRSVSSFPAADEDYFAAMDNGAKLSAEQVKGRDMWLVWSGGNDRFWDNLIKDSFGTFDLLKTISSAPGLPYSRDTRFKYFGVINEPCFDKPSQPDPKRFGLWLDKRRADCEPDPFANAKKYPGVQMGARGTDGLPVGSYYGEPTGIVGLRLFTNPAFDAEARRKWDPNRFYNDPEYYQNKDLVRPYRVGMSCAFCHIGPSPIKPPKDPENPKWENLNGTVGAQYFWFDRVFVWNGDKSNFIFQLLHTYKPGTLDTSLVSSDSIVNPRTMNAIYSVTPRLMQALPVGRELLKGGQLDNKQFNDFMSSGPLTQLYDKPTVFTPRVLKDGSDSVGALGALNRVYLNIGLFGEEWLMHFRPFVSVKSMSPIKIADAKKNSVYWQATEQQTIFMAQYLLAAGQPDRLEALPPAERDKYLTADAATLERGKDVFAENCARCHSGLNHMPRPIVGMEGPGSERCNGPNYLDCWSKYWAWTKTDDFKTRMKAIVRSPDFLKDNYLSTEFRVPVTLMQTNACSPLARNALRDNIWDNFSSESYKDLPSVGEISVTDPINGSDHKYTMPAGGRGYTRPPSLISLWSTAPYLLNNSVGEFSDDPSIETRMKLFKIGIKQMLWPDKRKPDAVMGSLGVGEIERTTEASWLKVPHGFLPDTLVALKGPLNWILPGGFTDKGDLNLGPIPEGTPVGFIGHFDPLPQESGVLADIGRTWKVVSLALRLRHDLAAMHQDPKSSYKILTPLGRELYDLSICPDYVVNRGHYFGTDRFGQEAGLTDSDKHALIEFLKTF
ncbi:MAG TPA: hypothetical protein VFE73_05560 [Reyranella sp.]|nr:hypothetical protein [Reyranella sp.]